MDIQDSTIPTPSVDSGGEAVASSSMNTNQAALTVSYRALLEFLEPETWSTTNNSVDRYTDAKLAEFPVISIRRTHSGAYIYTGSSG